MIVIRLLGGLGNQMFQYSIGLANSIEYNQRLFIDDSPLKKNHFHVNQITPRKLELNLFPEIKIRRLPAILDIITNNASHIFSKLARRAGLLKSIRQNENEFVKIEKIKPYGLNIVEGYFQSPKYFEEYSERIRISFSFPELDRRNTMTKSAIVNSNSVSIHVRRGDYTTNYDTLMYHGILPIDYYRNAIKYLKQKQNDLNYFIFTDDISWVKENFRLEEEALVFVEGNTGSDSWKDMALMTFAKHHIIANSSFSWWGAWLSQSSGTKIAPVNWFNPHMAKFDIHTIVPENWILL